MLKFCVSASFSAFARFWTYPCITIYTVYVPFSSRLRKFFCCSTYCLHDFSFAIVFLTAPRFIGFACCSNFSAHAFIFLFCARFSYCPTGFARCLNFPVLLFARAFVHRQVIHRMRTFLCVCASMISMSNVGLKKHIAKKSKKHKG